MDEQIYIRTEYRKYHYIYRITCDVTNRYYIGMHSTDDDITNDTYMGSGTVLWHSYRKHGKNNHKKQILEYCACRKSLSLREEEIVTPELLKDPLCMNLVKGGSGGRLDQPPLTEQQKQYLSDSIKKKKAELRLALHTELINKPFSMTKEEIIKELVLPNGNLNKNATRNVKLRSTKLERTFQSRDVERAIKWNYIYKELQNLMFPNADILELVTAYVKEFKHRPSCKICNNKLRFHRFNDPYNTYCGAKCQLLDPTFVNPVFSRWGKRESLQEFALA